jgi:hypothetical protein
MADIIAVSGLFFCQVLRVAGLRQFAPSVCFGGDTSSIGFYGIILAVLTLTVASTLGYRATHSAGVVLVVVAMSIMGVLSAALVQSIQ